jgi:hypothetical protein
VHDFNAGIGANGLFWIIQIPDDAVTVTDDAVTITLKNVAVVDQLTFPNTLPNGDVVNLGNSGAPATLSFKITYQKSGSERHVRPISRDPLSPFNWAGEVSDATNAGWFRLTYNDHSFSAHGTFSSTGPNGMASNFGEIGMERNGSFVSREDEDEGEQAAAALELAGQTTTGAAGGQLSATPTPSANSPKFKGKVPVEAFVH